MKTPKINNSLFLITDKSFEFAVDIVKLYESFGDDKLKFEAKQLMRYGTQIGAKVVRSGSDYTRSGFISCFAMATRRAFETRYWLYASYQSGYLSHDMYLEYSTNLEALCGQMDAFLKKIRLNRAILNLKKSKVEDGSLLQYSYN